MEKQGFGVLDLVQSTVHIEGGKVATYTFSVTDVCSHLARVGEDDP